MYDTIFYKILNEICEEKGISQKLLSYDWIRELKKGSKTKMLIFNQFGINNATAYRIASDKYATYSVLKENNIPIIEHKILFDKSKRPNYYDISQKEEAYKMLLEKGKVVLKANDSSQGKDVFVCRKKEEIDDVCEKIFDEGKYSLSICPYVDIKFEYRVVFLYNEILYIYKKEKPFIIGNGKNTIKELVSNKFYNQELTLSQEINLNEILKDGEKKIISWKHNLCNGATPIIIKEDPFLEDVKKLAINAANAIDINFATVDIALTCQNELMVMEINSNVCMNKFAENVPNGYEIAKSIYSKAIDKMFLN